MFVAANRRAASSFVRIFDNLMFVDVGVGLRTTNTAGSSDAFFRSTYCCSLLVCYRRYLLPPIVEPICLLCVHTLLHFTSSIHRSYSHLTNHHVTALCLTMYNTMLLLKVTVAERILQSTESIAVLFTWYRTIHVRS